MRSGFPTVCLVLAACPLINAESKPIPEANLAFIEAYCADCHDGPDSKGDLDLFALGFDLENEVALRFWTLVHDRDDSGEMPPPKKKNRPGRMPRPVSF